jgi:hypothetical protein
MCSPIHQGHIDLTSFLPSFNLSLTVFLKRLKCFYNEIKNILIRKNFFKNKSYARFRTEPNISRHKLTTVVQHL